MNKYYKQVEESDFCGIIGRDDIVISIKSRKIYKITKNNKCKVIGYFYDRYTYIPRHADADNLIIVPNNEFGITYYFMGEPDFLLELGKSEKIIIQFVGYAEIVSFDEGKTLEWVF